MVDINIDKHIFVPKHIKLTKEEAKEVLNSFNISKQQLPCITKKDAAIINLKPEPGDLIKVIRPSKSVGQSIFYRRVI